VQHGTGDLDLRAGRRRRQGNALSAWHQRHCDAFEHPQHRSAALPIALHEWVGAQPDDYLDEIGVERDSISDRAFYPRVVVGDYFRSQFDAIIEASQASRHSIGVFENAHVEDVQPVGDQFKLCVSPEHGGAEVLFDYVVIATGHSFPSEPETAPGFFEAPWPATALQRIPSGKVGILGTSLSAIDAVMTVATKFGEFTKGKRGALEYSIGAEGEALDIVMMSRKGLLPEADFYFPIPYLEPKICTQQAVDERIALGSSGLLDDIFELFRQELSVADPAYATAIELDGLTVDTFAAAYYGVRDTADPFEWAASNLAEAKLNYAEKHTVAWRYAILITHEIIETAVGSMNADDLVRFNRNFKSIFADDYATVPHLSIERLLALHRSGHLGILALGDDSKIVRDGVERGAMVELEDASLQFDTFIDATGQKTLSAIDLPFPSLIERGLISEAKTVTAVGNHRRTGGIDVDDQCRPLIAGVRPVRRLYVPAVSYLLHKRPFIQGITSAAELGHIVAASIIAEVTRPVRSRRVRSSARAQASAEIAA
jgi:uncharacterized NAD(P)/FAD-binding protein YdhS